MYEVIDPDLGTTVGFLGACNDTRETEILEAAYQGCLSTVVLAYFLCFHHMVSCAYTPADLSKDSVVAHALSKTLSKPVEVKHIYWLYNRCSVRHMQVIGRTVTAVGSGENATVIFESVSQPGSDVVFRIRSGDNQKFICFNKRGKLVAKPKGNGRGCRFHERLSSNMYTELESDYDPAWYIGFNKHGKALRGPVRAEKKHLYRCFQFIKRPGNPPRTGPDYGPPVNEHLHNLFIPTHYPTRHRKNRNRPTR